MPVLPSSHKISDDALDTIFLKARTHNGWLDKEVPDSLLQQVYDLAKWGPTAANSQPMRITFIKSKEAKERLKPHMDKGNLEKTMAAPATAIIAYDLNFPEEMPWLFPVAPDAKNWYGDAKKREFVAMQGGTLGGAYFIIAARALGLDCGPMGGFNREGIDKEFFAGTSFKSNFLVNIGYGNPEKLYPRGPRPEFKQFCKIL